jgi:formylglycine-generating enzyme required for sulfatase activity
MKPAMLPFIFFNVVSAVILTMNCTNAGPGNSSEVRGTLINSGGREPAISASVFLRPRDFLPAINQAGARDANDVFSVCSTATDPNGNYRFTNTNSMPEGLYCIEARDGAGNCVFVDSIMVVADGTYTPLSDTLKVPATIRGVVQLRNDSAKAFIRVYGLAGYVEADTGGAFALGNLPEGILRLQIFTVYGNKNLFDTMEVATKAGDTKIIDTLVTPLWKVTYDGNTNTLGSVPDNSGLYVVGDTAVVLGNIGNLAKAGFTFIGWNTLADGSGVFYSAGVNYKFGKVDLVLYAQWNPDGMVRISAKDSTFQMGDTFGYDDRAPVHPVRLLADFWLDSTEVTQGQYTALMTTAYPGRFSAPSWNTTYGAGNTYPAYNVNWYDAALFCNARTRAGQISDTVYRYTAITGTPGNGCTLENLSIDLSATGFRLPTEAQWEYAYRAGATDFNSDSSTINVYKQYLNNYGTTTHPVALMQKNSFRLYDMSWNVWEWCSDWYGSYGSGLVTDPTGPATGLQRVMRGGSWASFAGNNSLVCRGENLPATVSQDCGFRVCFPVR